MVKKTKYQKLVAKARKALAEQKTFNKRLVFKKNRAEIRFVSRMDTIKRKSSKLSKFIKEFD